MDATRKRADKLQAKGKTVDFKELLRMEPDSGTTNIRNVKSKHWTRWLGVENRCVVRDSSPIIMRSRGWCFDEGHASSPLTLASWRKPCRRKHQVEFLQWTDPSTSSFAPC